MSREFGNYVGNPSIQPNLSQAKGVWKLLDHIRYKKSNEWPQLLLSQQKGSTNLNISVGAGNVPGPIDRTTSTSPAGTWYYHVFLGPTVFTVNSGTAVIEYLIIGGGGGGAYDNPTNWGGGGGGAGGFLNGTLKIGPGTYPIVIGAGGASSPNLSPQGNPGNSTSAFGLVALGGGGGAAYASPAFPDFVDRRTGDPGGSGGGGTLGYAGGIAITPNLDQYPQGNPGGVGNSDYLITGGGGGGGAGESGNPGSSYFYSNSNSFADLKNGRGAGGSGKRVFYDDPNFGNPAFYPGVPTDNASAINTLGEYINDYTPYFVDPSLSRSGSYFAGGGGAGYYPTLSPTTTINGGLGGGGTGAYGPYPSPATATPGTPKTGGGGGGGHWYTNRASGGGAPGIVVIRYM